MRRGTWYLRGRGGILSGSCYGRRVLRLCRQSINLELVVSSVRGRGAKWDSTHLHVQSHSRRLTQLTPPAASSSNQHHISPSLAES